MSDSSGTNTELDQYGVWVKTPPHIHQEEAQEETEDTLSDFSFIDELPSDQQEAPAQDSTDIIEDITSNEADSDESVSLDEFISDIDTAEEVEASSDDSSDSLEEAEDGEISLDDFFDGDSSFAKEEEKQEEQDEDPLDIDLEFDDSLDVQTVDNSDDLSFFDETDSSDTKSVASDSGDTEGVDISDFFNDDAPAEWYLNGVLIRSVEDGCDETTGWVYGEETYLTPEQRALIYTDGRINVFAIHVHNNWGRGLADGGLYEENNSNSNHEGVQSTLDTIDERP